MKVLTAKTQSFPRIVATKYGEKSVIDVWVEGESQTIWRPANDPAIMSLRSNQEIQVAKDSRGKISLIDNAQVTQAKRKITQALNPDQLQGMSADTKRSPPMSGKWGTCTHSALTRFTTSYPTQARKPNGPPQAVCSLPPNVNST